MEGEEEVLKGTAVKYFELFPERNYKQGIYSSNQDRSSHFYLFINRFSCWNTFSSCRVTILSSIEWICHVSNSINTNIFGSNKQANTHIFDYFTITITWVRRNLRTERQLRVQKQNGSFQTHPHSHFTLSASALRIVVRIFRNPEYDTVK